MDVYQTTIYTPNMSHESNPMGGNEAPFLFTNRISWKQANMFCTSLFLSNHIQYTLFINLLFIYHISYIMYLYNID